MDRPLTPTASIQSRDREGAVTRRHAGERRPLWPHLVVPLAWLASFAAEYWLTLRQATRNSYLVVGWGEAFLPLPPRSMSDWLWLPRSFLEVFASIDGTPAGRYLAVVSLGLAMIGAVWLFRTDRFVFTLLTAPIAATIAASALKKYPFSHRLVFFLYPLFLLLLCAGLGWTMRRLSRMRYAPALLAALILGPPVAKAAYGLATQPATQDIKPLMRVIDERYREGDLVWVEPLAGPSFFYYRDYLDLYGRYPSTSICWDDCHGQSRDSAVWEEALAKAAGSRRVWVLATYAGSPEVEAERQLLDRLDNAATRIERVERRGCALTLYENPPQRADGP